MCVAANSSNLLSNITVSDDAECGGEIIFDVFICFFSRLTIVDHYSIVPSEHILFLLAIFAPLIQGRELRPG